MQGKNLMRAPIWRYNSWYTWPDVTRITKYFIHWLIFAPTFHAFANHRSLLDRSDRQQTALTSARSQLSEHCRPIVRLVMGGHSLLSVCLVLLSLLTRNRPSPLALNLYRHCQTSVGRREKRTKTRVLLFRRCSYPSLELLGLEVH